jgi:hypothetical protein
MFTWVCQRCGKEVDIAEIECPFCKADTGGTELGSAHGAARGPVEEDYPAKAEAPAARADQPLPPPRRMAPPASTVPRPEPPPHPLAIRPLHLALFLLVLLLSLAAAIYFARPDLFAFEGVSLPKLPSAEVAPLQDGPIEVAGIRAWRDAEAKLRVRAVMVNHTAGTYPERRWRVILRDPAAEEDAPAAASFDVELEEPLEGRASREVETELLAPEGLTALPEWNRIQVQIEAIEAQP